MTDRSIPEPLVSSGARHNQETILKTEDVLIRVMPLAPHESTLPHHHTEVTDTIVCLSGGVTVQLFPPCDSSSALPLAIPSEQKKAATAAIFLAPGERYTIPPFTQHAVCNMLDAASEYLLIQGVGRYDFITE